MSDQSKNFDLLTWIVTILVGVSLGGIFNQQALDFMSNIYEKSICKIRTSGKDASEVGENYINLCYLLKDHKFQKANKETTKIINSVAKKSRVLLTIEDIHKFPCQDLNTINQLWKIHSEGKFGFSAQKDIWIGVDGSPYEFDSETYNKFSKLVGWKVGSKFKSLEDKDFGYDLEQPKGHLPLLEKTQSLDVISSIFARIDECTN